MNLGFGSWSITTTASNVPYRNRVVVGSCDVELLILEICNRRCQNSTLMSFPSVDAVVFLAEGGCALVFAVLYSAIFLQIN